MGLYSTSGAVEGLSVAAGTDESGCWLDESEGGSLEEGSDVGSDEGSAEGSIEGDEDEDGSEEDVGEEEFSSD